MHVKEDFYKNIHVKKFTFYIFDYLISKLSEIFFGCDILHLQVAVKQCI